MPDIATKIPLATTTLSSAVSSVTFSSINGSYTDLVVVANALGNVGNPTDYGIGLQVNGDTGSNYSDTWLYGNGTSAVSTRRTNSTLIMDIQGAGYLSTTSPNLCIIHLLNYSNTTTYKTILSRGNNPSGGGGTASTETCVGLWRSTSAITSVKVICQNGSFGSNSTFTLYGIL
jgi:hypothetical protein